MPHRAWTGLDSEVDQVRAAKVLRRAHAAALSSGRPPQLVRPVISESWDRSMRAGVDPCRPAPRILDAHLTAKRFAAHRLHAIVPRLGELLGGTMEATQHFAAFSDADGLLLWSDGPSAALRTAVGPRFMPGFQCSEQAVGTNAIGTAIALDHPVQVYSAEHFNEMLHGWVCSAAPIHDPRTGEILGVIDLSGGFRRIHPHTLALVTAMAQIAESWLLAARQDADDRLRHAYLQHHDGAARAFTAAVAPDGQVVIDEPVGWLGQTVQAGADSCTTPDGRQLISEAIDGGFLVRVAEQPGGASHRCVVQLLGRHRARVVLGDREFRLSPRQSDILAAIAMHANGLTVEELAAAVYGDPAHASTVRAEIVRLRRMLGKGVILSRPYRLADSVSVDARGVDARGVDARGRLRQQP